MQYSKLNEWLSLVANVGVVIGIFALIAELNHASGLAEEKWTKLELETSRS